MGSTKVKSDYYYVYNALTNYFYIIGMQKYTNTKLDIKEISIQLIK